jgi:hypothetical protein
MKFLRELFETLFPTINKLSVEERMIMIIRNKEVNWVFKHTNELRSINTFYSNIKLYTANLKRFTHLINSNIKIDAKFTNIPTQKVNLPIWFSNKEIYFNYEVEINKFLEATEDFISAFNNLSKDSTEISRHNHNRLCLVYLNLTQILEELSDEQSYKNEFNDHYTIR